MEKQLAARKSMAKESADWVSGEGCTVHTLAFSKAKSPNCSQVSDKGSGFLVHENTTLTTVSVS